MRLHLFEFEDFSWFPDVIRSGGTDYLRYFLLYTELYQPTIPLISETLTQINETKIIDLCSGGGGCIEHIYNELTPLNPQKISITLTDKFPNIDSYKLLKERTRGGITYSVLPVDVFNIPKDLRGFRVMFSAIHHFNPTQVRLILRNAVNEKAPVAFFDGGEKGLLPILGLLIIHPLAFLILTPFIKPWKLSRLFFTYIIPIIPLYTIWDGVVSILRMYRPEELMQMAKEMKENNYTWKCGKTRNRFGIRATYLIGYPEPNK